MCIDYHLEKFRCSAEPESSHARVCVGAIARGTSASLNFEFHLYQVVWGRSDKRNRGDVLPLPFF